jgi:hypothetical protein
MSDTRHDRHGRGRVALAGAIVAIALTAAALLSGVGFAKDSISSSQYGQYGKKVTICHRTHSTKHPWVTITISQSAVAAHQKHGDDVTGPCPPSTAATKHHGKPSTTPNPASSTQNPGQGHGKGKGK